MSALSCGHPVACEVVDLADGESGYCQWCAETQRLQREIDLLTKVLHDKAVIVESGATLRLDGSVGYLVMKGGTVMIEQPDESMLYGLDKPHIVSGE